MAKEVSTGIRAFVKDSLNQYYKRFQIKLDDTPSKNSNKSAIKIHNDGSIYVYDVGNYTGSIFDNASTLQEVIKAIGQGHSSTHIEAGDNIQVDSSETTSTISALGYTYNQEKNSFAELNSNIAMGSYSHAEGKDTSALSPYSHVEGYLTETSGTYDGQPTEYQHAEGHYTKANGNASHAEGWHTTASGNHSHTEGEYTTAFGNNSHAEGNYTKANGNASHAEGYGNTTIGDHSHAEGHCTKAYGPHSHVEGNHTKTSNDAEHAEGQYNQSHEGKTIHSIGIGTNSEDVLYRKNAFEVMQDGSIYVYRLGNYDGSTLANASTLQDICNSKADKIINATANNLVMLDEDGNLQDSHAKTSDFVLHPTDFISIMYKKGTWMYSWEDDSVGEEMLSAVKSIAPSSSNPGVGIVYITDYPNDKTYVFVSTISWYKETIARDGREIDKYNIIIEFGMTKLSGSIETDGQSYYMGNHGAFSLTGDHPIFSPANQIATKIDNTPVSTIGFQMGDPIEASNSGDDLTEICRDYQSGKVCPVLAKIKHHVGGSIVNTDVLGYFIPTCERGHLPSVKLYFGGYSLLCYTQTLPEDILHWERGDEHIEWDIDLVKYSEIFE